MVSHTQCRPEANMLVTTTGYLHRVVMWCGDSPPAEATSSSGAAGVDVSDGRLSTLEDQIRDAIRTKTSVYEGAKDMLLRLFK